MKTIKLLECIKKNRSKNSIQDDFHTKREENGQHDVYKNNECNIALTNSTHAFQFIDIGYRSSHYQTPTYALIQALNPM